MFCVNAIRFIFTHLYARPTNFLSQGGASFYVRINQYSKDVSWIKQRHLVLDP